MKVYKEVLESGARVVLSPSTDTNSVTILFMVKTGSRNEMPEVAGISHFFEHMAFKGTKKRPGPIEVSRAIEILGAQVNAYTTKEYTGFYIKTTPHNFENAVEVLSDIVFDPLLDKKEIELEKGVILEELKMNEDNPRYHIGDLFEQTYFDNKRLSRGIIGVERSIKDMTREKLIDYHKHYYVSKNLVISLAGSLPNNSKNILKKYLSDIKRGTEKAWQSDGKENEGATIKSKAKYRDISQANLILGYPGVRYADKDFMKIQILAGILGGGMSSILFKEIRERRGLAYAVYADNSVYSDEGYLEIGLGVDKKNVEESLKVIKSELSHILGSLTEEELKISKERMKGNISFELENSYKRADFYARRELYGLELMEIKKIVSEVDKVKLGDVKEVAKKIFDKKPTLAVIGPFKNAEKFVKILSRD